MFEQQLEHWLQPFKTARQRAVFIFTPSTANERELILQQLAALISAPVWLSDTATEYGQMHRYRDYLGLTTQHVVLDFEQLIHADALAALAGTVDGGGCLWLVLPVTTSCFQQRLLIHAQHYSSAPQQSIIHCESWQQLCNKLTASKPKNLPPSQPPKLPSRAQQTVIDSLLATPHHTHVLLADRGRGKSTTLGLAIRQRGGSTPTLVTGPRPAALTTLLERADGYAEFRAWDRLLRDPSTYGQRLIIDEAAAIPLDSLRRLFEHYNVWAVASTVDGYEGCGQGFALRFLTWLEDRFQVIQHRLTEPLRWAADDSCEAWLNETLLLTSKPLNFDHNLTDNTYNFRFVHASQLTASELMQTVTLLLEAHYQSSPNDLRLLLDDPTQQLLLVTCAEQVIAVTWLATEGPLPGELKTAVIQGKRRLKGQLLPQALGFYRQQPVCLSWQWWRIVRIAVAEPYRRQHLGRKMVEEILARAEHDNITAVGTSFGVTPEVMAFWAQTPLREVRRGLKKNAASGAVSAIWACGVTSESLQLVNELAQLQEYENAWSQGHALIVEPTAKACLRKHCLTVLKGFCDGALPFSNARFAWWFMAQQTGQSKRIDNEVLLPNKSIAELVQARNEVSKVTLTRALRAECKAFLSELNTESNR